MRAKANRCCSPSDRRCDQLSLISSSSASAPSPTSASTAASLAVETPHLSPRGEIRPCREEEHSPFAECDFAAAERPNSGHRSQQGALPGTGRALDQQRFATSRRERNVTQKGRAIRQIEIDLFESNADIPSPNIDLPRSAL